LRSDGERKEVRICGKRGSNEVGMGGGMGGLGKRRRGVSTGWISRCEEGIGGGGGRSRVINMGREEVRSLWEDGGGSILPTVCTGRPSGKP
jgi:hypothetical protein